MKKPGLLSKLSAYMRSKKQEDLEDRLKMPMGYTGNGYSVTVGSDGETEVNGCRSLVVYEENIISVRLSNCTLTVTGEGLSMRTFFGNQIIICGRVNTVDFGDRT